MYDWRGARAAHASTARVSSLCNCPDADSSALSSMKDLALHEERFEMETRFTAAACVIAALMSGGALAAPQSCESLTSLQLPDTTITVAAVVVAGAFDPPGATPPIATAACRVAGTIAPTSDSSIA